MMNCMHTLSLTREDYEVIVAIADEMSVTRAARQLHLRNGLPAKGTLRQMCRHGLAAEYAAPQVRARFSKSAHATPNVPPT